MPRSTAISTVHCDRFPLKTIYPVKLKTNIATVLTGLALAVAAVGCDSSSNVGNVLDNESVVVVVDSSFTVSGVSVANPVVQSRTISQLLGTIDAPRYGAIYSDFVGQFMPSLTIDTAGYTVNDIDSVKLFLQMPNKEFIGDSLVPMGLEVYRLTQDLPYPIFSDFDPEGYYNPDAQLGGAVYTASTLNEPDTIKKRTAKAVEVTMPLSLGRELYEAYMADPEVYGDLNAFTSRVFKGLYIKSSYGSGRICGFTNTSLRLYYHKTTYNTDSARYETKHYAGDWFAITPEVVINNNIRYTPAAELQQMVADGDHILAAPAGYQVEINFPGRELVQSYRRYDNHLSVLNTVTFEIPADSIANPYAIAPPPYALLMLKNKLQEFYDENTVPDNKTGFYAAYNSLTGAYSFTAMRGYLQYLLEKDEITEDDVTFILCPVELNTEESANSSYYGQSSVVVTSVVPYVSKPAMARISLDKAKIKLTFSAQTTKNL